MRSLALAIALSLALVPGAYAKAAHCRDAKGRFAKCPSPAAAPASPAMSSSVMSSMAGRHPQCKKGKACGDACIAADKVCHK